MRISDWSSDVCSSDLKPDTRFGMTFVELKNPSEGIDLTSGKDFRVFDSAELIAGICMEGGAGYTRKQLDELTDWVKRPQIGASGMVYVRFKIGRVSVRERVCQYVYD